MRVAFTLAEVLVTLTILGILASIIVPNVVQRYHDRQTVTAVKRAYSLLDNAIQQMYIVEGVPENWRYDATSVTTRSLYFADKLKNYLSFTEDYSWPSHNYDYKNLINDSFNIYRNGYQSNVNRRLKDGTFMYFHIERFIPLTSQVCLTQGLNEKNLYNCTEILGRILVDINGDKAPNKFGRDVFFFAVGTKGLLFGNKYSYNAIRCSLNDTYMWAGRDCTYWVIKNGNLDYKYRDVSAEW